MLAALTPGDIGEVSYDQPFGSHQRDRADVYRPNNMQTQAGLAAKPLLVFLYGGSWTNGSRATYQFAGKALADLGYVTVVPDYRLYPEVKFPGFLEDNARAIAWAAEQAESWGADPERIVLVGHSAGAYNAAMLIADRRFLDAVGIASERIAGFVGLAGPYNFYPIINETVKPVFDHPNYPPDSQPIMLVHDGMPPSFIGAAKDDDLVDPQRNTVQLAKLLTAQGVPVTLRLYDRVGHISLIGALTGPARWLAPVLADIEQFLGNLD